MDGLLSICYYMWIIYFLIINIKSLIQYLDDFLNVTRTIHKLQEFEDFAKTVLLFSCASSSFSYIIFVIALWWLYVIPHFKYLITKEQVETGDSTEKMSLVQQRKKKKPKPLHPFDDNTPKYPCQVHKNKTKCPDNCPVCELTRNQDDDTTTQLKKKEFIFFILFLALNILILVSTASVFFFGQLLHKQLKPFDDKTYQTDTIMIWEIITVVVYLYSHFCTISSCFIFSKIMYGVQSKCSNLIKYLGHVDNFDPNKDAIEGYLATILSTTNITMEEETILQCPKETKILLYLKQRDKHFISVATKTLQCLQFWFCLHWGFYIISSLLSIALVPEAVLLTIKGTIPHTQPGVHFSSLENIFLALFAISNSFMFLYPCFRAASITKARKKLISDIVCANTSISDHLKNQYVKYLKAQKFCFRLNILCTNITFSVNIAYISICIGLLGVLVSLVASITLSN